MKVSTCITSGGCMSNNESTKDRILDSFLQLLIKKGYKGTTTRAIAEVAGVNEVTIFRQFGSKKAILEEVVQSFSYAPKLAKVMKENISWELEKDLMLISDEYQNLLEELKGFILIGFREAGSFPEIDEEISKVPRQLMEELTKYFYAMQNQGKIISETNIEAQVMNFIWINFGYFISNARLGNQVTSVSRDEYLKNSIQLFTRGLTP